MEQREEQTGRGGSAPLTCADFRSGHSEWRDGRMPADAAARWTKHVGRCGTCARYDAAVRAAPDLLCSLPAPTVAHDFEFRLRHRIVHLREEERARAIGSGLSSMVPVALAAALALVAWSPLLTGLLETSGRAPAAGTAADVTGSPAPVQRLETEAAPAQLARSQDGARATSPSASKPVPNPFKGDPLFDGDALLAQDAHHVMPLVPAAALTPVYSSTTPYAYWAADVQRRMLPLFESADIGYPDAAGGFSPLQVGPPALPAIPVGARIFTH